MPTVTDVANLITALHNPSPQVRHDATLELIDSSDLSVDMELIKFIQTNDGPGVCSATLALGQRGRESAMPFLSASLITRKDPTLRQYAAFGLGCIAEQSGTISDEAIDSLMQCLEDRSDSESRLQAIVALGKIKDPRVTPALVKIMIDENEEESLRRQAQESLNNMDGELQLRGLVACLGDDNPDVCSFAKNILGKIERPQAVVILVKSCVSEDEKQAVRFLAPQALTFMDESVVVNGLRMCLEERDEKVRDFAQLTLRSMGLIVIPN